MKILAIDDQQLILSSIKKRLTELSYEVKTASSNEEGILLYNSFNPDLVLLDMNMPEMSGNELVQCTGIEVVKYIRVFMKRDTPILVLSGNTDEAVILENFNLGINDYLKKPVSLDEMAARVRRIIGAAHSEEFLQKAKLEEQILRKNCVGLVIPCFNEEQRLLRSEFKAFSYKNIGYHLCFVNDGSSDNTLSVLRQLRDSNPDNISVYNCKKNVGKAEAIRQGMLRLTKDQQFDYVGFLDADLSTDFQDFNALVSVIENSDFKIVSGSRMVRVGTNINKHTPRQTISVLIQKILGMPLKDTQCGAKIMDREIASLLFNEKFITKWLFDVEIFMRMKKIYGRHSAQKLIYEQPLQRWKPSNSSKTFIKYNTKTISQITQITLELASLFKLSTKVKNFKI